MLVLPHAIFANDSHYTRTSNSLLWISLYNVFFKLKYYFILFVSDRYIVLNMATRYNYKPFTVLVLSRKGGCVCPHGLSINIATSFKLFIIIRPYIHSCSLFLCVTIAGTFTHELWLLRDPCSKNGSLCDREASTLAVIAEVTCTWVLGRVSGL